jgi:hypothetical protein
MQRNPQTRRPIFIYVFEEQIIRRDHEMASRRRSALQRDKDGMLEAFLNT